MKLKNLWRPVCSFCIGVLVGLAGFEGLHRPDTKPAEIDPEGARALADYKAPWRSPIIPDKLNPNYSWTSVSQRDAAWKEAIRQAAARDLHEAFRLFKRMPVEGNEHPREMFLAELLATYGPTALKAAVEERIDVASCFNGLRKAKVGNEVQYVEQLRIVLQADSSLELGAPAAASIMRYIRGKEAASIAGVWDQLKPLLQLKSGLDSGMISALAASSDPTAVRLVEESLTSDFDKARFRHDVMESAPMELGSNGEQLAAVMEAAGANIGISSSRRFAVNAATQMAVSGNEVGALTQAAGLSDPVQRQLATDSVIGYLRGKSSLNPLLVVLSSPDLREDQTLLSAVIEGVTPDFGTKDAATIAGLRNLALQNPQVAQILRESGIEFSPP